MYKNYGDLGNDEPRNRDVMNVLELSNAEHKRQIIQNNRVVVVDIYADWCGPCKQTAPDYATIASEYSRPGECAVVKYNYDKVDPSERSRIHGIPVFQFFVEGQQVDEVVGADIDAVKVKLGDILKTRNNRVGHVESGQDGPQFNRNSIRNTRNNVPNTSGGQSYTSNTGNYYTTRN